MDSDLAATLAELQRRRDHEEIRQLLRRYARGADRAEVYFLALHPRGPAGPSYGLLR